MLWSGVLKCLQLSLPSTAPDQFIFDTQLLDSDTLKTTHTLSIVSDNNARWSKKCCLWGDIWLCPSPFSKVNCKRREGKLNWSPYPAVFRNLSRVRRADAARRQILAEQDSGNGGMLVKLLQFLPPPPRNLVPLLRCLKFVCVWCCTAQTQTTFLWSSCIVVRHYTECVRSLQSIRV